MEDFEQEIRTEFLTEAEEMLDPLEHCFIELEQDSSNRKMLDEIFRYIHSIKGGALSTGFDHLGNFAHVIEAFLSDVRAGKLMLSGKMMDVLLQANDKLKEYIDALRHDQTAVIDVKSIASDLNGYLVGEANQSEIDKEEPTAPVGEAVKPVEDHKLIPGTKNKIDEIGAVSFKLFLTAKELIRAADSEKQRIVDELEQSLTNLKQLTHEILKQ